MVVAEISSMMVRSAGEWSSPPVHGDEAEHAVLDPVPLRGPRRVVAHRDLETGLFGQLGELDLPGPEAVAVGPSGIRGDQEALGAGEAVAGPSGSTSGGWTRRRSGGVGRVADVDPPLVVGHVVDAIGDGLGVFAEGGVGEVVDLDAFGLAFG